MKDFYDEKFIELITPIINTENFIKQKEFMQHGRTSVYTHVIEVAYLCYKHANKFGGYDMDSLLKGALLHDYFLYDWHLPHGHFHGYKHPRCAMKNAIRDYGINKKTQRIILTHMFPITITDIPTSKEGRLVAKMDKLSYKHETKIRKRVLIKQFNLKMKKKLSK